LSKAYFHHITDEAQTQGGTSGGEKLFAMERRVAEELKSIVGKRNALLTPEEILVYESDGVSLVKGRAEAVLLPGTAGEVAAIVRLACANKIPYVARGAGTGLSGGCSATEGGWVISTARLNRILERLSRSATTSRPIRPARRPAPSAETSRKIPAARTA